MTVVYTPKSGRVKHRSSSSQRSSRRCCVAALFEPRVVTGSRSDCTVMYRVSSMTLSDSVPMDVVDCCLMFCIAHVDGTEEDTRLFGDAPSGVAVMVVVVVAVVAVVVARRAGRRWPARYCCHCCSWPAYQCTGRAGRCEASRRAGGRYRTCDSTRTTCCLELPTKYRTKQFIPINQSINRYIY